VRTISSALRNAASSRERRSIVPHKCGLSRSDAALSVTALDAFDPNGDGAAGTVRLYNASGTVLASAKVTTTDPKEGSPIMFFSAKLSKPLVLAAETTYFIAEDLGTATTANGNVSGLTTSSAIKYDGEVAAMGQGKNPTTDATGGMFSPGIFGPNFDLTLGASAVPEPATWAMMLSGFAGLGYAAFRRNSKGRALAI
jgi:PEP-CTERM motif-containing protein